MTELVIMIATLTIIIFAWSKISKALDWTGAQIGNTGDMLSDLTISGAKQTSRGVAISHGSLKDTIDEQVQKDITRTQAMTKFKAKLTDAEKTDIAKSEAYYAKLLER